MEAKDLRIGNWVLVNDTPNIIRGGGIAAIESGYFKMKLDPIPLTPEILVKAGFEKIYKSQMHTTFYKDKVSYYFWHQTARQYADFMGNQYDNIQNVHQLQNLIHALTGEELNIQL